MIFTCIFSSVMVIFGALIRSPCHGDMYEDNIRLLDHLFGNQSNYNPNVLPVRTRDSPLEVNVQFSILSIVELNDKDQSFIINAFLFVTWVDQILSWSKSDFGNISTVIATPDQVYRPSMIMMNTLGRRNLFEDDKSPLYLHDSGLVTWVPGCLFPASCKLNMNNFPFDEQRCVITMIMQVLSTKHAIFTANPSRVYNEAFTESGDWEILDAYVVAYSNITPYFDVVFHLRRRPAFFVINVLLPVIVLSFLNNVVFVIPVESGEKISYGITVLLALALFMSTVSDMLPRSSQGIPMLTIYLLSMLVVSACTVIVAAISVWLHYREEVESKRLKAKFNFKSIFKKVRLLNRAVKSSPKPDQHAHDLHRDQKLTQCAGNTEIDDPEVVTISSLKHATFTGSEGSNDQLINLKEENKSPSNKYKTIVKFIDSVAFVVH